MSLKVYSGTYDGLTELVVLARSKKAAHGAVVQTKSGFRASYGFFAERASVSLNEVHVALTEGKEGVVFANAKRFRSGSDGYAVAELLVPSTPTENTEEA